MKHEITRDHGLTTTFSVNLPIVRDCRFPRRSLVAAVNLGGDADTIGAVCGQIAGGELTNREGADYA